jgi:hypothetical protein
MTGIDAGGRSDLVAESVEVPVDRFIRAYREANAKR